jgi:PTH1 family peptidyl-tRNA hydrolase
VRKAVVGLGNPGSRYADTRHNAGFLVLDRLASARGATFVRTPHGALCADAALGGVPLVLVKPQTYMNRSGEPVAALARHLALDVGEILVVHDELDLPLGRIKLKRDGGTAGHRGLESLVAELGSRDFPRLRIGIGRPPEGQEVVDWVLAPFAPDERQAAEASLASAVEAVAVWCTEPLEAAMNRVNAGRV